MPNRRRLANKLAALLKQYDKEIQDAFLSAIRNKANGINLRELSRAIEARDLNRVIRIAGITRADLFPLDASINSAYVAGGLTVPAAAPAFAASFGFDGRASRAEQWARLHVGGLVQDIVDEQLDLLREVVAQQVASGTAPRLAAVRIAGQIQNGVRQGGLIGLNRAQTGFLAAARQELTDLDVAYFTRTLRDRRFDGIVRKAIASGKPLSRVDIERISQRYSDRLLKHRADMIARTESITALRAGRREGILQGIEAGAIRADRIKRVWSATLDSRTRKDHTAMNGKEVDGIKSPFSLPDGSRMLYPGDTSLGASASQTVNCRCYDEYVVDWLRP